MSKTTEKKPRTNHLELARRIIELIQENGMGAGDALSEQQLARTFQVSRTLIRAGLNVLVEQGMADHQAGRGYALLADPAGLALSPTLPQAEEEELVASVLRDRMAGRLSNSVSISEIMRRYGIGRPAAQRVLAQLSEDQVVERGPGQSWQFRPLLDNLAALDESLRYRMVLEPEALLAPGFEVDRQRLSLLRDGAEQLLRATIEEFDIGQFRELDISFHEMIATCCGNRFVGDALLHHQRLRRLPNLLPMVSAHRLQESLREHLRIIEHIERGQLEIAADLLRLHLRLSVAQRPQTANRGIPQAFHQRR
ncbi:GntR family transcriptional regulator [Burkholderia sp. Ac-20353]|uniref:GntR family transcriptional regulator n=1 Tax=Burkholderia sp. Ac-20353 TaxID=2703894 RepID=UPI00197C3D66|nr:GntR family transcriptional regulator [Burkholderia sp. Ac-20353]MBN3785580.1 GntR family transcriptional regulator [Burkholderia sp. Ac-20353]